jgi:integrase
MSKGNPRALPRGITPKTRTKNGKTVPVVTEDGTPVYRVRVWDPVLKKQIERIVEGLDAAKQLLEEFTEAKRRPGRLTAERVRFADVAARYLVAYKTKRDGTPRPRSSLAKEHSCLNIYLVPVLGNAWIGDLDLPDLNETIRNLTLQDGSPASGGTKSTVASVLRRLFAWAREERIIPTNPALELRTGWGGSVRRRVLIPSIPQVLRLAAALDEFKPGLGDVAMVLAFTGLRWEEAVAVPIEHVDLDGQWIKIDRTASESGGRRDIRADLKTRAAERVVAIPDIAMPAVRRLAERGAAGRERSEGEFYGRLINGERGGYLGYAMWRRYLKLAHGYTASHKDGIVKYTAHELRHVCASLLIASGASDMQVANQMGHSKIETTKNIYGHLFAQDRAFILEAMNQAVSRLYVEDDSAERAA